MIKYKEEYLRNKKELIMEQNKMDKVILMIQPIKMEKNQKVKNNIILMKNLMLMEKINKKVKRKINNKKKGNLNH